MFDNKKQHKHLLHSISDLLRMHGDCTHYGLRYLSLLFLTLMAFKECLGSEKRALAVFLYGEKNTQWKN